MATASLFICPSGSISNACWSYQIAITIFRGFFKGILFSLVYSLCSQIGLCYLITDENPVAKPITEPAEPDILYLDISINGSKQPGVYEIVRSGKDLWFSTDQLEILNLKDTAGLARNVFLNKEFFLLPSWVSADIKMEDLSMELSIPAEYMEVTVLKDSTRLMSPSPSIYAFYWNYDLSLYHQPLINQAQFLTAHKPVFTSPYGSLSNQFITKIEATSSIVRLETSYSQDYLPYQLRFTVGDFATDAPSFISTVAAAGFKISKGFLFQTGSLSYPSMVLAGFTPRPGDAEIWINDTLRLKKEIPMGGFLLDNLNLPQGANNGELIIKDANGLISSIPFSYYADAELLRPGLTSYSYSLGFLRKNYGTKSFSYGGPAFFGSQKIGISNFWTTSLHTELSLNTFLLGLEQRFKLFSIGSTGLATAATMSSVGLGYLISPQLQLEIWRMNFRARALMSSGDYRPITMPEKNDRYPSLNFSSGLMLNLPYVKYSSINYLWMLNQGKIDHTIGLRQMFPSFNDFNTGLSIDYDFRRKNMMFFAFLSYQFVDHHRMTMEMDRNYERMQTITGLNGSTDQDKTHRMAYNVSAELSNKFNAYGNLNYENSNLRSRFDILGSKNSLAYVGGLAGSLAFMKGQIFFSRPVEQGLILIELPGQEGVQIYQNSSKILGKTNSDGYLLIPNLLPYDTARLNVDLKEISPFANSDDFSDGIELTPGFQTAHAVKFSSKMVRYLHFNLIKNQETLLPGTLLNIDKHEQQSFVMNDGDVYLEVPQSALLISGHDELKSCLFQIPLMAKNTDAIIEELGDVHCRP